MEHQTTRMKHTAKTLLLVAVTLYFSSCYYDSEEYLYPLSDIDCDTLDVTYANFVSNLLATNCNSCHSASAPSGNIITADRNNLQIIIDNGKLEGSLNHLPGFSPMPKGQNQLPACDLAKINAWLANGAP